MVFKKTFRLILFFLCLGKICYSQGYGISANAFFDLGIKEYLYSPFTYGITISPYLVVERHEIGAGLVIPVVYATDAQEKEQKFSIGSVINYKFYLKNSRTFKIYLNWKTQYIFTSRKYLESSKYEPNEIYSHEHLINNIIGIGHKIQLAPKFGINTNFGYSFPIIYYHNMKSDGGSEKNYFSDDLKTYCHFDFGFYKEF